MFAAKASDAANGTVTRAIAVTLRARRRAPPRPYPVKKFKSFSDVIAQRKAEARRSLVVQVNSETSFNELYGYCSKYASIKDIHHYRNSEKEHFMLIEFETEENVKEVIKACSSHQKDVDVMPIESPFLWFRAAVNKKELHSCLKTKKLATKDGIEPIDDDLLYEELLNCETVTQQIQHLYERTKLNDLGVRLRYMVARQFEIIFKSLYANVAVQPFGSSVNGYGRMGCDLDLVLSNVITEEMSDARRRLVYQEKREECAGGGRGGARQLELLGMLLELRVPGAGAVRRVLAARVPILKCTHHLAALHCDLAASNTSGVYMSELLWQLGALDPRVRPLIFVVRRWASAVGLTNSHPGRWITNFPLTLMVLFFLQQKRKSGFILPSLKLLVDRAGKEDIRIAEENINCTFLRDLNKLPHEEYGQSDEDLHTLLLQFFEFYAQFDFKEYAISINKGVPIRKPNALPLYIVNPLEQALNVSRNVSYEECERLRAEVRNAAWLLEEGLEGKKSDDWGVLRLIERKDSRSLKQLLKVGNSHRLVSVKDLFNEDDEDVPVTKSKKTDAEVDKSVKEMSRVTVEKKEQKIKFKNSQIANEVYRIRRNKIV
ncbi:Poly(A) RNA polymerase, mitochondrial [Papilio xuthus]|uniref:Poly(A) RNA polymerase, mitochondrial n=1 Tax=Papilio xuthus TaxID=66420 RepID=A0A194QGL1_PAPXU|nr:Poly(A) RNA polymerase, mitochondrial [Papilio xuthus]